MSIKIMISWLTAALISLTLVAAQCGVQPAAQTDAEASTGPGTIQGAAGDFAPGDDPAALTGDVLKPVGLGQGDRLKVVATTNIVGDLVHQVAGDSINLIVVIPIATDPHTFSPAPQDVAAVAEADVVFISGLGFEEFLDEMIANAGTKAPIVATAENIETIKSAETDGHDHTQDGVDPHVWMNPANTALMVQNIEKALSTLDPANASTYAANAELFEAQLVQLDAWVAEQIDRLPPENRAIVTDHDALGYYANRYGLEVIGAVIPAYSTNASPSAQELAKLQDAISEFEVKAVFVGTTVNPVLAEQLATDTGIQLVPLYTGSLGEAGSGAETYVDLIRYNTMAIVQALK